MPGNAITAQTLTICFAIQPYDLPLLLGEPDTASGYSVRRVSQRLKTFTHPQDWTPPPLDYILASRLHYCPTRFLSQHFPYLDLADAGIRLTAATLLRLAYPNFPQFTITDVSMILGVSEGIVKKRFFKGSKPENRPTMTLDELLQHLTVNLKHISPLQWLCRRAQYPSEPLLSASAATANRKKNAQVAGCFDRLQLPHIIILGKPQVPQGLCRQGI